MDIALLVIGFILMLLGILGSFLPVLPGPPVSWVGLLMLHLTKAVPDDWWFLGITAAVALIIFALDYVIPAIGAKKFGGTRAGMIGTTIGLIISNKTDNKTALKAAFGSFLGLLTGTFMKFTVTAIFLVFFFKIAIENGAALNPF